MKQKLNRRVVILQRGISRHRLSFYEQLRDELNSMNIELAVVYGHFGQWDQQKNDFADIPWGQVIQNKVIRIMGRELYWQPAWQHIRGADLVIAEQANRLLLNYLLQLTRKLQGFKFAYWGHGRNFQTENVDGILERLKSIYSRYVDWWFAYTAASAERLKMIGIAADRMTVVQNAADTDVLTTAVNRLTPADLQQARQQLGIKTDKVGVYCGGLYKEKRVDFLLEAVKGIRQEIADFEFIVIGSGPEAVKVEALADECVWLHFLGPKFGAERVPYMKLARIQLMPGLVGLGIVDSFVLEVPLVTTDIAFHSPEISYLHNHQNGVMVEDDIHQYISASIELLRNDEVMQTLRDGCRNSAAIYTVENMVRNFARGIVDCLEQAS